VHFKIQKENKTNNKDNNTQIIALHKWMGFRSWLDR